jgi:DMSO/TMAO reductase YedYZ molybdopterin-dependent catalytic subunit
MLHLLGLGGAALAAPGRGRATSTQVERALPAYTGPGANPYWNSVGPLVILPQKAPLIQLTDRPVQLETPRHHFLTAITPNAVFFVRWHLDELPTAVDLSIWRLRVEGHVERPLSLSLRELLDRFPATSVVAVNQCSGNSRSRFQPRVPGGQWGNGAMGCARWTGVRLKDLLGRAGPRRGALQVQFEGLDRGKGPEGLGSRRYQKSLDLDGPALDEALLAYAMNDEPLPLLNGFPLRLVVPGYFSTYWVKSLQAVRLLDRIDDNFWMKSAYLIPDTPRGTTTPAEAASGKLKRIPIGRMPVRSFVISPDGSSKLPQGLPVSARGIAFSGHDRVVKVELSTDGGRTWERAQLGEDHGRHAFRTWEARFVPRAPGRQVLAVRATDGRGNVQTDEELWNPGGYLWNRIERQEVVIGPAA